MLQDGGLPRKRREHIRELTYQVLQLALLGSGKMGVDVYNQRIRGSKGGELISSPNPFLRRLIWYSCSAFLLPGCRTRLVTGPIFSSTV